MEIWNERDNSMQRIPYRYSPLQSSFVRINQDIQRIHVDMQAFGAKYFRLEKVQQVRGCGMETAAQQQTVLFAWVAYIIAYAKYLTKIIIT